MALDTYVLEAEYVGLIGRHCACGACGVIGAPAAAMVIAQFEEAQAGIG